MFKIYMKNMHVFSLFSASFYPPLHHMVIKESIVLYNLVFLYSEL